MSYAVSMQNILASC